jgi:hypothetical protein
MYLECLIASLIRVINLDLVIYAVNVSRMGRAATLLIFQSENMTKSNHLVDLAIDKTFIWKSILNWCEDVLDSLDLGEDSVGGMFRIW